MVPLAAASYLMDKADRLSPAAEKKRTNGPSFVKQMPCMKKQTPSELMLIRWRLRHLEWSSNDRIWWMCELTLIWLFLFSTYICHDKNFGMISYCWFQSSIEFFSSKHSIWVIRITLILPFQISCLLVPVARVANKVQIVVIFCNFVWWLNRVIKLICIYIYINNFLLFHDEDCVIAALFEFTQLFLDRF